VATFVRGHFLDAICRWPIKLGRRQRLHRCARAIGWFWRQLQAVLYLPFRSPRSCRPQRAPFCDDTGRGEFPKQPGLLMSTKPSAMRYGGWATQRIVACHPPSLENDMKKLAAALIASLFATVAFAQTPAPAETAPAPTAAPKVHKHKVHNQKKVAPAKAASGA
jgi:hypothetical protein